MAETIETQGLPSSLYTDRGSHYCPPTSRRQEPPPRKPGKRRATFRGGRQGRRADSGARPGEAAPRRLRAVGFSRPGRLPQTCEPSAEVRLVLAPQEGIDDFLVGDAPQVRRVEPGAGAGTPSGGQKPPRERRVRYGHVFRNAMLIVVAGFPSTFVGILFTGALLIEVIFSLDGLGLLGFEAVLRRDYPVIFGTLYVFSLLGLVMRLVGDLMYVAIALRIDFESRET